MHATALPLARSSIARRRTDFVTRGHSAIVNRSNASFGTWLVAVLFLAAGCGKGAGGLDEDPDGAGGRSASGGSGGTRTTGDTGGGSGTGGAGGSDSTGGAGGGGSAIDGGRNVPDGGRVAFYLGQDTGTLDAFATATLHPSKRPGVRRPDGVTLYTAVLPTTLHPNTAPAGASLYLAGIEGPPADEGNGAVDFDATLARYDALGDEPVGLAVGLYLSDGWANCGNQPLRALIDHGEDDVGSADDPSSVSAQWRKTLDRLIVWLDALERPVFLRIGYEFDGPWNCYNQDFYKAAFRYVKERIDALGAERVATVWQAATYPDDGDPTYDYQVSPAPREHYEAWYPGDDVVDWIGISFFSGARHLDYQWSCVDQSKPWTVPDTTPRVLQDTLADFARDHEKPLIVAESAPQGFDVSALTYSCVAARQDHLPGRVFDDADALYEAFFTDYFAWMRDNADVVRAFSYIDTHWQAQPRWSCAPQAASCPEGYWGDTRLEANTTVLDRFFTELGEPPFSLP